jgi:hypothetical protein
MTNIRNRQWIASTASIVNRLNLLDNPGYRNEIIKAEVAKLLPDYLREDYHINAVINAAANTQK